MEKVFLAETHALSLAREYEVNSTNRNVSTVIMQYNYKDGFKGTDPSECSSDVIASIETKKYWIFTNPNKIWVLLKKANCQHMEIVEKLVSGFPLTVLQIENLIME